MASNLSQSNGAARERSRAFLDGWQLADRVDWIKTENSRPWAFVDLDVEPTTPVNGVLLACFLRGMSCRFGLRWQELDDAIAIVGD